MANTVLLVDDDPQLSHIVSMYFEIEGFAVLTADTGEKALELLNDSRPDVVLLDLMMPGMDGLEVCRRIRANPRLMNLRVIVFTAAETREDELREAGADAFIAKPYSLQGLGQMVRDLIAARSAS
jgi:DNA-binding response OmpR family regulator